MELPTSSQLFNAEKEMNEKALQNLTVLHNIDETNKRSVYNSIWSETLMIIVIKIETNAISNKKN